jgi:hypothetical protein
VGPCAALGDENARAACPWRGIPILRVPWAPRGAQAGAGAAGTHALGGERREQRRVRRRFGCGGVADGAAICRDLQRGALHPRVLYIASNNRSKFNVALGVESQGFCVLPPR